MDRRTANMLRRVAAAVGKPKREVYRAWYRLNRKQRAATRRRIEIAERRALEGRQQQWFNELSEEGITAVATVGPGGGAPAGT